jgi:putative transposase
LHGLPSREAQQRGGELELFLQRLVDLFDLDPRLTYSLEYEQIDGAGPWPLRHRIVGSRCEDRCDTDLILGAPEYAVWSRGIRDSDVIHHSDRGSNGYPSVGSGRAPRTSSVVASTRGSGNAFDNAMAERFSPALTEAIVHRQDWPPHELGMTALSLIEGFRNTLRHNSRLDTPSPLRTAARDLDRGPS